MEEDGLYREKSLANECVVSLSSQSDPPRPHCACFEISKLLKSS